MELEIDVAQFAQRAVGADLRGADGAFEDAGDLGEREFLKTREQQHLAIIAIELGERGVEKRVIVAHGGMLGGVRCVVSVLTERNGIGGVRGGVALAEVIGGAAAGEMIHPGGEAAVVAVGVAVFEHPLKHGLRDILGRGTIAGVFREKAEKLAVVALEEFAERVEFAIADCEHERVIGALIGGGVHGSRARRFNRRRGRMNTDFVEGGNHGGNGT